MSYVRERHAIAAPEGASIELWWQFTDDEMSVRQHQSVTHAGPYYVVSSELGVPRRAWDALRVGAIRFGTLVEDGDRLELRAYLPESGFGRPTLDHTLHAVAYEAARLAMEIERDRLAQGTGEAA